MVQRIGHHSKGAGRGLGNDVSSQTMWKRQVSVFSLKEKLVSTLLFGEECGCLLISIPLSSYLALDKD